MVLSEGKNAALKCFVQTSASLDSARRWEPLNLTDGYFWCLPLRGAGGSVTSGGRTQIDSSPIVGDTRWLEVDLGQPEPIDEIHLVPAHPAGLADLPGYGFPPHFQVLADSELPSSQVLLNELEPVHPAEALPNPGAAQLMRATRGLVAQRARLAAETLWRIGWGSLQSDREFVLALAELQCWQDGRNLAAGRPVTISDSAEGDGWSAAARRLTALQRQLARDLHDEIGASLSELAIQSDLARQQQARQLDTGQRRPADCREPVGTRAGGAATAGRRPGEERVRDSNGHQPLHG